MRVRPGIDSIRRVPQRAQRQLLALLLLLGVAAGATHALVHVHEAEDQASCAGCAIQHEAPTPVEPAPPESADRQVSALGEVSRNATVDRLILGSAAPRGPPIS
ncbi:hypothetical protein ABI59_06500 [Acidobacteria bacterium Mor1]|nr:hypothetical protein ABI59_06500 [Acidobacteria bacterium Mor1]